MDICSIETAKDGNKQSCIPLHRCDNDGDKTAEGRVQKLGEKNQEMTNEEVDEKGDVLNKKIEGEDEYNDDEGDHDDEDEDVDGEEEEEEEEDTDMTPEEKQLMYECVRAGDIDSLEDCLDQPNADINMIWFQENLLMAAIRAGQPEMAEFLVDNGVDHTFVSSRLVLKESSGGKKRIDRYEVDCRQMAFEHEQHDLVFLLDHLQGRLFPFVPAPIRTQRFRRPPPSSVPSELNSYERRNSAISDNESGDDDVDNDDDSCDEAGDETFERVTSGKKRNKKIKKNTMKFTEDNGGRKDSGYEIDIKSESRKIKGDIIGDNKCEKEDDNEEEDDKINKTAHTISPFGDVDSGHYSMTSSQLKKSLIEKHNKLLDEVKSEEEEMKSPRQEGKSPPKSVKSLKSNNSEQSRLKSSRDEEHDDTYETLTPRTTTTKSHEQIVSPLPIIPHPPDDLLRHSRSIFALQRSSNIGCFYKSPLYNTNMDKPLKWRKICTTGSYSKESRHWHRDQMNSSSNPDRNQPKSNTTLSKLPPPSPPLHLSRQPMISSVMLSPFMSSPRVKSNPQSSAKTTTPTSSNKPNPNISELKNKSPAKILAGYLRPTKSTLSKKRLNGSFVGSYGGMRFLSNTAAVN